MNPLSAQVRSAHYGRTEVLERVGTLALLPDGMHASRAQVAAYYEVGTEAINSLVKDHRAELTDSGMFIPQGPDFRSFRDLNSCRT